MGECVKITDVAVNRVITVIVANWVSYLTDIKNNTKL